MSSDSQREFFQHLPFPFANGAFPAALGAAVQVTVLNGEEPAREVIHTPDGSWLVGDLINDPNVEGAAVATHIWHAIEQNSSMVGLASMPPGHVATRSDPGQPWQVARLEGWDEDD